MRTKQRKGWYCPREDCGAKLAWEREDVQTQGQWYVECSCPGCRSWLRITKLGIIVLRPGETRAAKPVIVKKVRR